MTLVLVVAAVALAAAAVVAVIVLARRRRAPQPQDPFLRAAPEQAREVLLLGPGAVVSLADRDWTVRGTLRFDDGASRWSEHLLDDTTTKRWLSVEEDVDVRVSLWEGRPLGALERGGPGERTVVVEGSTYLLDEQGQARFEAVGSTGTQPFGSYAYADYIGDAGLASLERFGDGTWELGVGRRIDVTDLTVYPPERP